MEYCLKHFWLHILFRIVLYLTFWLPLLSQVLNPHHRSTNLYDTAGQVILLKRMLRKLIAYYPLPYSAAGPNQTLRQRINSHTFLITSVNSFLCITIRSFDVHLKTTNPDKKWEIHTAPKANRNLFSDVSANERTDGQKVLFINELCLLWNLGNVKLHVISVSSV